MEIKKKSFAAFLAASRTAVKAEPEPAETVEEMTRKLLASMPEEVAEAARVWRSSPEGVQTARIREYLSDNPGSTSEEISIALSIPKHTVATRCTSMRIRGEVRGESAPYRWHLIASIVSFTRRDN